MSDNCAITQVHSRNDVDFTCQPHLPTRNGYLLRLVYLHGRLWYIIHNSSRNIYDFFLLTGNYWDKYVISVTFIIIFIVLGLAWCFCECGTALMREYSLNKFSEYVLGLVAEPKSETEADSSAWSNHRAILLPHIYILLSTPWTRSLCLAFNLNIHCHLKLCRLCVP